MSKTTPSARSAALLRSEGWLVDTTEKRLPRCFISVDLYHAFDLVGIRADRSGVLGLQVTTTSNQSKRWLKLVTNEAVRVWLLAGNGIELHGWRKSRRSGKWEVTRRPVTLADLGSEVAVDGTEQRTPEQPSADAGEALTGRRGP